MRVEKAMATHSSTLAWKIPWTEEPGGLQSMGSLGVRLDWATSLSLFTFMHWRRKWQPTPVFLPGESQGRGSLVGCRLWDRTESDTTEAAAAARWEYPEGGGLGKKRSQPWSCPPFSWGTLGKSLNVSGLPKNQMKAWRRAPRWLCQLSPLPLFFLLLVKICEKEGNLHHQLSEMRKFGDTEEEEVKRKPSYWALWADPEITYLGLFLFFLKNLLKYSWFTMLC